MAAANAQNMADATRFGSTDITGSARYMSMAGAMGAVGGDVSCMGDNPAGIAVLRGTNMMSFSPSLSLNRTTVNASLEHKINKTDFAVDNLAYVASFKTPTCEHLVNFNVGVGFNHSAGTNRRYQMVLNNPRSSFGQYLATRSNNMLRYKGLMGDPGYMGDVNGGWEDNDFPLTAIFGYDCLAIDNRATGYGPGNKPLGFDGVEAYNTANPDGLVEGTFQRLKVWEQNRNDEYNISLSGNWDDMIYGGLTLSISDFNSFVSTEFNEDYQRNYAGPYTEYQNDIETKGSGVNLKAGIIIRPSDAFRIGVAVHTPTWMHMTDIYSGRMITDAPENTDYSGGGTYEYDYRYFSPWEYQVSFAAILGRKGLISVEYDMKDFTSQKFYTDDYEWDTSIYDRTNSLMKDNAALQHTIKVGGEYRILPNLSARLGYAYRTSPFKSEMLQGGVSRGFMDVDASRNPMPNDDNTLLFDSSTKPNYSLLDNQQYITAGLGWRGEHWFIDLAFVNRMSNEVIAAYPTTDAYIGTRMSQDEADGAVKGDHIEMKSRVMDWNLTLGFRF